MVGSWESREEKTQQWEAAQHPECVNMLSGTLRQGQVPSPLFSYFLKGTKRKMGLVGHNTPISKLVFILFISIISVSPLDLVELDCLFLS